MARTKSDILPGTLDLLILKTLSLGPRHGYGIAQHIQRLSDDVLRVEEGSLYPALQRLLRRGLVRSEWRASDNNRRARYYEITPAGRQALDAAVADWRRSSHAVNLVLRLA